MNIWEEPNYTGQTFGHQTDYRSCTHVGAENFCVNSRFQPMSVGWNQGLTWKRPTPTYIGPGIFHVICNTEEFTELTL